MEKRIDTQIRIESHPNKVWEILTNFEAFPKWNPFIKSITGVVKTGNRIKVILNGMTFKPKVLQFNTNTCFEWKGKLFIKGIFDGQHKFELVDNKDGSTTLLHSEEFSGLLSKMILKKIKAETQTGFIKMNEALKMRCEES